MGIPFRNPLIKNMENGRFSPKATTDRNKRLLFSPKVPPYIFTIGIMYTWKGATMDATIIRNNALTHFLWENLLTT